MFKNKKEENKKNEAVSTVSGSNNSIVTGTKLEGTINANSDIRIDGELVGKLFCKGRVIIGPSGMVDGEVDCQNAIIEGKFTGNLKVSELLTLKENATISGDIKTDKINIQTGASFNGKCSMGGQSIKSSQKSNGALTFS
jgi:cytoskeletal protein CcmA (bactofilin family)